MLRRLILLLAAASLMLPSLQATVAEAGGKCQQYDPTGEVCLVWIDVPDNDPGQSEEPGDTHNAGSSKCMFYGDEIPCNAYGGHYRGDPYNCYMVKATPAQIASSPQLTAEAPKNPGKSAYLCQTVISVWNGQPTIEAGDFIWVDDGEAAVDPREAARQVLLSLGIKAIDIGLSPRLKGGANGQAYVGVPVWMWAANPSGQTVGPISAHNSDYGVLVIGEARLTDVAWNMGDGHTVHCKGAKAAGKVYKASYGVTDSPACGYRYKKMSSSSESGRYAVSATSYWEFTWQAGGMQGMIPFDVTNNTTLPVGEIQVVVTGS